MVCICGLRAFVNTVMLLDMDGVYKLYDLISKNLDILKFMVLIEISLLKVVDFYDSLIYSVNV